jgi:hypothetical protein
MVHSREIDDPERARHRIPGLRRTSRMIRLAVALAALALGALYAPAVGADDAKTNDPPDAIPGSPRPFGLGLSPEAPPVPPAPGGRAPSFGAPVHDGQWSLQIGGRIAGFEAVGIGRRPASCASAGCTPSAPAGYSGTSLHVPPLVQGRLPFYPGAGATLYFQYGNPVVTAYVLYYARISGSDYNGYYNPQLGPSFGQAYLTITPEAIGNLHLSWRVGAFVEVYGGPGQWGWGVFGPMMGVRGMGETTSADIDVTPDLRLSIKHGVLAVPGVPENFVRGDYDGWIETGVSSYLQHAHLGFTYKNQYSFTLHYDSTQATDERKYLYTFLNGNPHDGRFDTFLAEGKWIADPWGQLGVTAGLWNFDHAASVGDGTWWGLDWTQGAREMINKYLGPYSGGNGKVFALSAEFDTSLARILWFPRSFDGRGPDVGIRLAGIVDWTLASDDRVFKGANGFMIGTEIEYKFSKLFSLTLQGYGESRTGVACASGTASVQPSPFSTVAAAEPCFIVNSSSGAPNTYAESAGRWAVYSVNPGIAFHTDWLSTDRIQFLYSRRFYSSVVDNNIAAPLDRDVFTLGGYFTF